MAPWHPIAWSGDGIRASLAEVAGRTSTWTLSPLCALGLRHLAAEKRRRADDQGAGHIPLPSAEGWNRPSRAPGRDVLQTGRSESREIRRSTRRRFKYLRCCACRPSSPPGQGKSVSLLFAGAPPPMATYISLFCHQAHRRRTVSVRRLSDMGIRPKQLFVQDVSTPSPSPTPPSPPPPPHLSAAPSATSRTGWASSSSSAGTRSVRLTAVGAAYAVEVGRRWTRSPPPQSSPRPTARRASSTSARRMASPAAGWCRGCIASTAPMPISTCGWQPRACWPISSATASTSPSATARAATPA